MRSYAVFSGLELVRNLLLGSIRTLLAAAVVVAGFFVAAPALAGTSDNVEGWLWSGTIGWVSMNCTNNDSCATADYGVTINGVPGFPDRGNMTGYSWSETLGWVCFGATCTGTTPEGGASYAQYRGDSNDEFFGWAQVVSMGANGWISLNCQNLDECATSQYATVIDPATGFFTKGAAADHWAWGANDDATGVGWVDMSSAATSWVEGHLGTVVRPQGIYEPENSGLAGTHLFTFAVKFTSMSAAKNYGLECEVQLPDGARKVVSKTIAATVRGGSETLTYTVQNVDPVQFNKIWYMNYCRLSGYKTATSCTQDDQCGNDEICDETVGKCRPSLDLYDAKKPIFTHVNTWTGLGGTQDQYGAVKCHAGFPGTFFNNPSICDFGGDASFSLAQRRGFPVEGDCGDGTDNDGNGETDCADRYCQGISYRCRTAPPASCFYGDPTDGILDCSDPGYAIGDLCCTQQPTSEQDQTAQYIVNGLECEQSNPNDGYYDCSCDNQSEFDASGSDDCFAQGAQVGDLCCSAVNEVVTK